MITTVPSIASAAPARASPGNERGRPGGRRAPPGFSVCMYDHRMKGTRRGLHVAMILLCAWTPHAWADSIDERMAPCLACHGEKGQSANPEIPSLGAQPSPYVLIQLYLFREKLRRLDIMNDAVKGFTDDDLRTFADTISRLPPPRPTAHMTDPPPMARAQPLVRQYGCNVSHNPDLSGRDNMPRIAGQREAFLV